MLDVAAGVSVIADVTHASDTNVGVFICYFESSLCILRSNIHRLSVLYHMSFSAAPSTCAQVYKESQQRIRYMLTVKC